MISFMDDLKLGISKLEKGEQDAVELEGGLVKTIATLEACKDEQEVLIGHFCGQQHQTKVQREILKEEKGKVQFEADDINAKLQVVTVCLEKFEPVLGRATAALKSITPHDVNISKAMINPPKLIRRVMGTVLILLQRPIVPTKLEGGNARSPTHKSGSGEGYAGTAVADYNHGSKHPRVTGHVLEPSWNSARELITEFDFLQQLITFPKEHLNEETVELVLP